MTTSELAETLGLTYAAVKDLRRTDPWIDCWAALEGGGAANMTAWLAAGRPAADLSALCYEGPRAIGDAFRAALQRMPEAPAHFLVNNAVVTGSPRGEAGSCGGRVQVPCADPFVISMRSTAVEHAAHEAAHAWAWDRKEQETPFGMTQPETIAEVRAMAVETLNRITVEAVETGRVDELLRLELKRERLADALASAWLGETIDTVTCRIERVRAEIQQRAKAVRAEILQRAKAATDGTDPTAT